MQNDDLENVAFTIINASLENLAKIGSNRAALLLGISIAITKHPELIKSIGHFALGELQAKQRVN